MRNTRWLILCSVVLFGLSLGLVGCNPETEVNPVVPNQVSVIEISFNPETVVEQNGDTYRFMITMEETNGVGCEIESIEIRYLDGDGNKIGSDENWDQRDVVRQFGSARIEALGKLRGQIDVDADSCFMCKRQNWRVWIHDDLGNERDYSGSVQLIAQ
jgi:hypothetical protein